MDPVAITAAFTGAKHAAGLLKAAADTLKTLGKTEVIGDLIEAQLALMELIQKQGELLDENRALQKEVETLKEQLEDRGDFVIHRGFAFRMGPDGKYAEEAYCPNCKVVLGNPTVNLWSCPKCKFAKLYRGGRPSNIAIDLNKRINTPTPREAPTQPKAE